MHGHMNVKVLHVSSVNSNKSTPPLYSTQWTVLKAVRWPYRRSGDI